MRHDSKAAGVKAVFLTIKHEKLTNPIRVSNHDTTYRLHRKQYWSLQFRVLQPTPAQPRPVVFLGALPEFLDVTLRPAIGDNPVVLIDFEIVYIKSGKVKSKQLNVETLLVWHKSIRLPDGTTSMYFSPPILTGEIQ